MTRDDLYKRVREHKSRRLAVVDTYAWLYAVAYRHLEGERA